MKKIRHTKEQVIRVLREAEGGTKMVEIYREYGISDATYYNWKEKYGGMTVGDPKKLKALGDENWRLKQIVADLPLDNQALNEIVSENF